jgi:hypothetical protein
VTRPPAKALRLDGGASGFDAAGRVRLVVVARGRALAQGAVRGEAGGRVASVFRMTAAVNFPSASLAGGSDFGHDVGENSAVNGGRASAASAGTKGNAAKREVGTGKEGAAVQSGAQAS